MKAWFPFLFLFLVLSLPVMCADPPGQDKKIQNCFGLTLNGTALRLNDKWEPPEGAELVGTKDAPGLINIKWMRNIFGDGLLANAALDRLTHHSQTLVMRGSSFRQRGRRKEETTADTQSG